MENILPNNNTLVALFLSEILRSRRTTVQRAAEISSQVLRVMHKVKNETELLNMLGNLETEFEEVGTLKQALHFGVSYSELKLFEPFVRQYAAELFKKDMEASTAFLKDAAAKDASIQQLCIKYPAFCQFLTSNPEVAAITRRV